MHISEGFPPMIFSDHFIEHVNIGWRIEPAKKDLNNPLLEPKYPWDNASPCIGHGTVMKDPRDSLYKAWVVSAAETMNWRGEWPYSFRLTYACSEDGVRWTRPELDVCSFLDYSRTNILFDRNCGGCSTYASVFVASEDDLEESYEMFVMRDGKAVYRYRSRDGLHWRSVEGPIDLKSSDTLYIYKVPSGGYVCHQKNGVSAFPGGYVPYDVGAGTCRIILQRTSPDGSIWSEAVPIMVPDWQDHSGDQIMEVGYYPYGKGIIGVTAIYHAATQTMDLQFAASEDGRTWWRPARRPCLALEPLGDYGGGLIWPTRTLIDEGEQLWIYYGAVEGLHGDLYAKTPNILRPFAGAMCRASWEKGRMWAVVPAAGGAIEARITTPMLDCAGKTLRINALTVRDGEITAELLDRKQKPIKGFTRRASIPFRGNDKFAYLRWKEAKLSEIDRAHIRLYLKRARLYGYELT